MSSQQANRKDLEWAALDAAVRGWWDDDLHASSETGDGLIQLPYPYVTPGGAEGTFAAMFAWDSYFINRGLLVHGRLDLVRGHIENYVSLVERVGFMPNSNARVGTSRSQTPVFPDSIWRYYQASGDRQLLERAFLPLVREFSEYWNAEHHRTPVGLAAAADLGDGNWPPELAAEAETGLDWTPIYGADVRRCAPLVINCALIRYAEVLASIAGELGRSEEVRRFRSEADHRRMLVDELCWDEDRGVYLEYDHVAGHRLPYLSACAYWPMWAGVPSPDRARRLVENLRVLVQSHGLSTTDRVYPDPHRGGVYPELSAAPDELAPPEALGGRGQLQWMHPAGWAPLHLVAVDALDGYGYHEEADRIATSFLALILARYRTTGRLWEKYNVVDGTLLLPNARYGNVPMRGWTAATAVVLGHRLAARR